MIYLDHAATSYPKPVAVLTAIQHWFADIGVSADRGDGPRTQEARSLVQRLRANIARRTGHEASGVAFCSGATEGLNLTLRALLAPGAHVLTTPFEHSSVVRPLLTLREPRKLQIDVALKGGNDPWSTGALEQALCDTITALAPTVLVFSHASNVIGTALDATRLCKVAREHGTISVVDASQTAGYLPLNVGADIVVASGHKALHGPPGIGFVSVSPQFAQTLAPQKQGGTGSSQALEQHPTAWPQAFEAGTPNTPALFGLAAALDWLDQEGEASLLTRSMQALAQLRSGIGALAGMQALGADTETQLPVLSVTHDDYDPTELGTVLASADVHARSGFHCAPWMHTALGTEQAGTLRLAPGPLTTAHEVETVLEILHSL